MIQEGEKAPHVEADSTQGRFALSDLLETGPVVLYFFPKADSPG